MATKMHVGREPHSRRTNLETHAGTSSISLASSLNDSLNSQRSQTAPNAASDLNLIRPHGAIESSISFSDGSSQERRDRSYLVEPDGSTTDQDEEINVPAAEETNGTDHTSAPKRMVNGEFKHSESSLPTSPITSSHYKHSRNSSRTSRGSQIGEVRTSRTFTKVEILNHQLVVQSITNSLVVCHGQSPERLAIT